jgi:hypothetical protein
MTEARMLKRTHPLKRMSQILREPGCWEPVFFIIAALSMLLFSGYLQINWASPGSLSLDHLFSLTGAKDTIRAYAGQSGELLGFPEPRSYLYFPNFDWSYGVFYSVAGHLTRNPFVLIHFLYTFGLVSMGCAYYWTLRRLGISAWLAVLGGLAAAITPYFQERIYNQDDLALSFSVPVGFGLGLQIARNAQAGTLRTFFLNPMVVGAMLVIGVSGLYYACYSVLIAAFIGLTASVGEGRLFPILAALLIAEVVLILLVLCGYGLHFPSIAQVGGAGAAGPDRFPFEQLVYGLNLAKAGDRFSFIHKVAVGIDQTAKVNVLAPGDGGEWPGLLLTLAVLATPLVAAAGQMRLRTLQGPSAPKLRLAVLCATIVLFMVWFGARGGLGYLFNLILAAQIRADSRVLPVFTFGVVVMLCLFAEMAKDSDRRWVQYAGPSAIALVLLVSAGGSFGAASAVQTATLVDPENRQLMASLPPMLAAKDKAKLQTVLQLPVVTWPEAFPNALHYISYQQQLPFVFDRIDSKTRWSYGANEKQAGFRRLQAHAAVLPGLDDRARRMGFDSILVDKRGYDAQGLAKVQAALGPLSASPCRLYDDRRYTLYALNCAMTAPAR